MVIIAYDDGAQASIHDFSTNECQTIYRDDFLPRVLQFYKVNTPAAPILPLPATALPPTATTDKVAIAMPKSPARYCRLSKKAFTGALALQLAPAKEWATVAAVIRRTPSIIYFDYETTGIGGLNRPVQLGAVRVNMGQIIDRFNIYMDPLCPLSEWSAANLQQSDGSALTNAWLKKQVRDTTTPYKSCCMIVILNR